MSTHSVPPASSTPVLHRVLVPLVVLAALLIGSLSPLRSVAMFRVSRTLANNPVHLFPHVAASKRLRRADLLRVSRGARSGYWHTEGSRIVSDRHQTVRISGLNWSGFETPAAIPGGLRFQDYHAILRLVASSGYNTVRLPFSNQMVEQPTIPTNIAFENEQGKINTDLEGLDSMQILDHIVAAAGEVGLKVILDDHRSEAGSSAEESGLWYTEQYPEQAWISDWVSLAQHFRGNPTVIGVDLRNEPHNAATTGACWSCGGARDWHRAAERAGNAILQENGNLLIFVEGVDQFEDTTDFWGGDLAGVRKAPVRLALPGRLVYSAHVYGPSEYNQPWFNAQTTPASLVAKWRRDWSFISESGAAPVWIGEFGIPNDVETTGANEAGSEGQWFQTLVDYLVQHSEIGWTYWSLNGEDRYGLLDGAYQANPASAHKSMQLARIRMPKPLFTDVPATSALLARNTGGSKLKFPFHLLSRTPHKNSGPEIVVVYDDQHPASPPTVGRPTPAAAQTRAEMPPPPRALPQEPARQEEAPVRGYASSSAESTGASRSLAEQIRRQTESALDHLPPDTK